MAPRPPPPPDRLAALLSWIELHPDETPTLDAVAREAGLSPYHFARMFTARMGRSPMAYFRGRRLVRAARHLAEGAQLKLLDLALDSGFESQEAFTRAFKRTFGVAPGRFRQGFAVTPIEGQYPMAIPSAASPEVRQLPNIVQRERFTVAGFARRFDEASKSDIPQLWSRLIGRLPFAGQVQSWNSYGVVSCVDRDDGSFRYLAGVAVQPQAALPEGMERMTIPAARYAVFRIVLTGGGIHLQVKAAMATIWGELIPAAGLTVADGPDFELYDARQSLDRPGAVIDFHVPVAAGL